jgi:fluoroquinolone resistance protein
MDQPELFSDDKDNVIFEFKESFYRDIEFKNVRYREKRIKDTEFYNCTFLLCDFIKSEFLNCEFEKCSFLSSDLSLIKPDGSKFVDVSFNKSKLIGVNWTLIKALSAPSKFNFYECKIDSSSFQGLNLQGIKFIDCTAHDVDFYETDLSKSDFTSTDLLKSRFVNTNLNFADLSKASNYNIDPSLNKLKKTIFSYPEVTSLLNFLDIVIK